MLAKTASLFGGGQRFSNFFFDLELTEKIFLIRDRFRRKLKSSYRVNGIFSLTTCLTFFSGVNSSLSVQFDFFPGNFHRDSVTFITIWFSFWCVIEISHPDLCSKPSHCFHRFLASSQFIMMSFPSRNNTHIPFNPLFEKKTSLTRQGDLTWIICQVPTLVMTLKPFSQFGIE